jgi:hypothetical protein
LFHLENPYINSTKINEAMGNQPLFIELPVGNYNSDQYWDGMNGIGGLLVALWDEASEYFSDFDSTILEDRKAIVASWEKLLGRRLDHNELFNKSSLSANWSSDGSRILEKMLGTMDPRDDSAYSGSGMIPAADFVDECNIRSLFNSLFANFIELPYLPNVARLPFREVMYKRAMNIQRDLAFIKSLNNEYTHIARKYSTPEQDNLVLPFFLNVILTKISSLSDFYEALADLRFQAEPFRRHRADLDDAFNRQDVTEIQQLQLALQQDAKELGNKFPYAPTAGAIAAVLAAISMNQPNLVLLAIGVLTYYSQNQGPEIARLKRRVLRPQYHILSNLNGVASSMVNSLPKVNELWHGLNNYTIQEFTQRFERLKTLRYG